MPWKQNLQILDFSSDDRLEARCKKCGYTWYEAPCVYAHKSHIRQLFVGEFEKRLCCKQWNCKGSICLSMTTEHETEGFQGGLA